MPKQRITKQAVVDAAFEIARSGGMEQLTVTNISQKLGCSVQPIYSYCKNMDALRQEVAAQTRRFLHEYVASRSDKDDLFRSTGQAYVQFAKDEPQLFRIFILSRRDGISSLADLYQAETDPQVPAAIAESLHISVQQAMQLHLNMLIYTIGIGTIFSVTTPGISADEIYTQQQSAYEVFLHAAERGIL